MKRHQIEDIWKRDGTLAIAAASARERRGPLFGHSYMAWSNNLRPCRPPMSSCIWTEPRQYGLMKRMRPAPFAQAANALETSGERDSESRANAIALAVGSTGAATKAHVATLPAPERRCRNHATAHGCSASGRLEERKASRRFRVAMASARSD